MWYLIIFLCLSSLPIFAKDQCAFRDQCQWFNSLFLGILPIPCEYNGPPLKLDDDSWKNLMDHCPMLASDDHLVCCDNISVHYLKQQLTYATTLLQNCPPCKNNFQQIFCQMICSPNQARFITITDKFLNGSLIPDKYAISSLKYDILYYYFKEMFISCKDVTLPGIGKSMDLICGTSDCDMYKLAKSLGQKDPSPFTINFNFVQKPSNPGALNITVKSCVSECSCMNCQESCFPNYIPDSNFTLFGIPGFFILLNLYGIFAMTILIKLVLNHLKKRNDDTDPLINNDSLQNTSQRPLKIQYQNLISNIFESWTKICIKYPKTIISVGLIITSLMCTPLYRLEITTDPLELWNSPKSVVREEKNFFDENFGPFYRTAQIIAKPGKTFNASFHNNQTFSSVYNIEFLSKMFALQKEITDLTVNNITLGQICYLPLGNKCAIQSIFGWFQNDYHNLMKTNKQDNITYDYRDHIIACASNPFNTNETKLKLSCLSDYKGPVFSNIALGGINVDDISTFKNSSSIIITFIINDHSDKKLLETTKTWEAQFLKYMKNYSQDDIEIYYYTMRSVEDELERQSKSDFGTLALSYIMMFLYISLALGHIKSLKSFFLYSKISLGFAGVLMVLLSVLASIGLMTLLGNKSSLIIMEVIPFLVLAVGVDNIFLLMKTHQKFKSDANNDDTLVKTVKYIGPTLLLSSLSECTCFFLGALTDMPAVKSFALNSAFALLINFCLQMSVFIALMSLDNKREEASRYDVFCCFSFNEENRNYVEEFIPKIFKKFVKFLIKDSIICIVLLLFFSLTAFSIMYIDKIDVGLDQELSMPFDSYVLEYFEVQKKELVAGPPVFFVINGSYDYSLENNQRALIGGKSSLNISLMNYLASAEYNKTYYISLPFFSWLDSYISWAKSKKCLRVYNNGTFCPSTDASEKCSHKNIMKSDVIQASRFFDYFESFLKDEPNNLCIFGGKGLLNNPVNINNERKIIASHFSSYHTTLRDSKDFINAMKTARFLSNNIEDNLNKLNNTKVKVFPYSVFYVFYEQYLHIVKDAFVGIIISICSIFIVTLLLLKFDLRSSFIILITIASIEINLLGMMYWWNISLNAVSLVNLIMSVGISVEFCSHIVHAYLTIQDSSRKVRVIEALSEIGSSVFSGIVLTKFLGVVILAFAQSRIFTIFYFRMYLGIILIGALHGFILLPILLIIFGGNLQAPINSQKKNEEE